MQTTLVLIKPDAVERGLIGQIITRLESKGLKISGLKMIQLDDSIIEEHYDFLVGKPFFLSMKDYMKRTPVVALVISGIHAVDTVRNLIGATNPQDAIPGSIRGDFGLTISGNIVHASDSEETAIKEIKRFFKGEDIFEYIRYTDTIV